MSTTDAVASALLPLWREVLESGTALPSEAVLADTIGASRPAVREALIRMEEDGLVLRRHGSGTYPNPAAHEVPTRLGEAVDFADRLAAVGYSSRVEVIDAQVVTVDADHAPRLAAVEPIRLLRTVKRWWADDRIAVVAVDLVPLALRTTDDEAVERVSDAVVVLAEVVGHGRPDWMFTWPDAALLDADTAGMLGRDVGEAVLRTEQLGVDRHGRRVLHAVEHHCPGIVEYGLIRTIG